MPDVSITIGGREFSVSCQEGEEHYLRAAADMLDREAAALSAQTGRLPEARMLLMAGLMLGDKAAGMDETVRQLENRVAELERAVAAAGDAEPQRVEVPVIPDSVSNAMAEIAARAEALAGRLEEAKAAPG